MKTEYFVRSTIPVRLAFADGKQLRGDRFDLVLTVAATQLDADGFVVDFERVQRVLRGIRDWLEQEPISGDPGADDTVVRVLRRIRERAADTLGADITLKRVELMGHEEGFALEMDSDS